MRLLDHLPSKPANHLAAVSCSRMDVVTASQLPGEVVEGVGQLNIIEDVPLTDCRLVGDADAKLDLAPPATAPARRWQNRRDGVKSPGMRNRSPDGSPDSARPPSVLRIAWQWRAARAENLRLRPHAACGATAAQRRHPGWPDRAAAPSSDRRDRASRRRCRDGVSGNGRYAGAPRRRAATFWQFPATPPVRPAFGGADLNVARALLDIAQGVEPRDVNKHRWPGEAHVEHRHQRLSAGDDTCLFAVLCQQGQRLIRRVAIGIVEAGSFHRPAPKIVQCAGTAKTLAKRLIRRQARSRSAGRTRQSEHAPPRRSCGRRSSQHAR